MQSEGARPAHQRPAAHREPRGWYVPRKLPHFDSPDIAQAVTFRLGDALPADVVRARLGEADPAYRRRIEAALDAGAGACLLREPAVAAIVAAALQHEAGTRYDLHAYVIMPNHVHVLFSQAADQRLGDIVHGWKSWSAKEINKLRGDAGRVWQRDYFDRFMRDDEHFERTLAYIENNPVVAGLAAAPEFWPFGSAARRIEEDARSALAPRGE